MARTLSRPADAGTVPVPSLDLLAGVHADAQRTCLALAKRFDLGVSGGSDYHGSNKPTIRLGQGYGGLRVSSAVLEDLKDRRDAAGLHI